jgi:hypothetical protein
VTERLTDEEPDNHTKQGDTMTKTNSKMFTFWCGWEVPREVPGHHMAAVWPAGSKGWISGWTGDNGDDERVYVGRIDAASVEDARAILRSCYGESGDSIRERWEPVPHEIGWRDTSGRFPE